MYRITHEGDTYIAEDASFETETIVTTGGAHDITYRVDRSLQLRLSYVIQINGEQVPARNIDTWLGAGDATVTVEPIAPEEHS